MMGSSSTRTSPLPSIKAAKESAKHTKTMLLGLIKEAKETRLEIAENKHVLMAATVLNCEGVGREETKTGKRI